MAEKKEQILLEGERPIRTDDFKGCVFHTRCPYAADRCMEEAPCYKEVEPGHRVACHLV